MGNAIDKLRDEMAKHPDNPYIQHVGEYLTGYVSKHPEAGAAILADRKTIEGSCSAAREEARKKAVSGVAVVEDADVYACVLKYYGIAVEKSKSADVCAFGGGLDLDALLEQE